MDKMEIIKNNVICTKAIIDYKDDIEYTKSYLKRCEDELRERMTNNDNELTLKDVREAFGYGRS